MAFALLRLRVWGPLLPTCARSFTTSTSSWKLELPSVQDTLKFGEAIANVARPKDVIFLHGDLGSGKSVFARGLIKALLKRSASSSESSEDAIIASPTFLKCIPYQIDSNGSESINVQHMDFYRVEDPSALEFLDLRDIFAKDISVIEWASRMRKDQMPEERLEINLSVDYDKPVAASIDEEQMEEGDADSNEFARNAELIAIGESWVTRIKKVLESQAK